MRPPALSNNSTVAAVLAKDLATLGARRCFGLLGTANFKISHGLVEAGIELISARHEGNAASMADAYAKATGELTLVSVHSGPGLTNAITGIGEAAKKPHTSSDPCWRRADRQCQIEFLYGAGRACALGWCRFRTHLHPAIGPKRSVACGDARLARSSTVVLSLPLDMQETKTGGSNPPLELSPMPGRLQPNPDDMRRLVEAVGRAKRPLVLAGRGAVLSEAEGSLITLADNIGALLATSICGHGLFADNQWSLGISGGFSSPAADELISESDLILGFGVSFTQWTTKKGQADWTGRNSRPD